MTTRQSNEQIKDMRAIQHRFEDVVDRQEELEGRLEMIENTLQAVAEEQGLSIGGACTDCEQSLLVIDNGRLSCPVCDTKRQL